MAGDRPSNLQFRLLVPDVSAGDSCPVDNAYAASASSSSSAAANGPAAVTALYT